STGDAITGMAMELRRHLRVLGRSEIFALHRDASIHDEIKPLHELPLGRPGDVLIYHASFGEPTMTRAILDRVERLVLVFHNITPSRYFVHLDPDFAARLEWAHHELLLLRERVSLSIAVSSFNAEQLTGLGYRDVHVIPSGLRPGRLTDFAPEASMAEEFDRRVPGANVVVAVSQVLPHKRHDILIHAVHVLQWVHTLEIGLVIVGPNRFDHYTAALKDLARRLRVRNVWFTGRVSDRALSTILRKSSIFVSASEHEGLGIPPLEAMRFGLPVVVREAGATYETVGDAALLLPGGAGPLLFAEAIRRVLDDSCLRSHLVSSGFRHTDALIASDPSLTAFIPLISAMV
ncbi:MAG: glycosyltransferase family 4 protein, partial [Candidatus Limnocylindrales bacterium]